MGTKNKDLICDLLAKAKKGEELDIVYLSNELRRQITADDTTLGKFRELTNALRDIVPDEKQRYSVAMKALSTTLGVGWQKILESTGRQIEELQNLETGAFAAIDAFRDELNSMESRSKEIKSELARLRHHIKSLEEEEQEILAGFAAGEINITAVEEEVRRVFTDIGAEIKGIRANIEEFTNPNVSVRQAPPPDSIGSKKQNAGDEEIEIELPWAQEETKTAKTCPVCKHSMKFLFSMGRWMCHGCGHEELESDPAMGEDIESKAGADEIEPERENKRECLMCGGHMNLHAKDSMWMCYSCGHQEPERNTS